MEKEFVTYELALRMKQLGFNEPCLAFYGDENDFSMDSSRKNNPFRKTECVAPTYSQAFRWFREKYGLFTQPNRTVDKEGAWYYFSIETKRTDVCEGSFSYEEAELACMEKLIEIVENK
jgi:hypothetical protein